MERADLSYEVGLHTELVFVHVEPKPSLYTGDALYFIVNSGLGILKYNLNGGHLSGIKIPDNNLGDPVLMVDDGSLGFATMGYSGTKSLSIIELWSWQTGLDGTGQ